MRCAQWGERMSTGGPSMLKHDEPISGGQCIAMTRRQREGNEDTGALALTGMWADNWQRDETNGRRYLVTRGIQNKVGKGARRRPRADEESKRRAEAGTMRAPAPERI